MLRRLMVGCGAVVLMGLPAMGQTAPGGSARQDQNPPTGQPAARPSAGQVPGQAGTPNAPTPRRGTQAPNLGNTDVLPGPIDGPKDLLETARMLFMLTDTNGDNLISEKEAIDAGNLLVGGFFFRADANGDGTLTKDEAQQARDALFAQQPILRFVLSRADKTNTPENAAVSPETEIKPSTVAQQIGQLLDANNDRQLQAAELRQAVQTGVKGLFVMVDANHDGQVSPAEINAGALTLAREGVQTAFQTADADKNGGLSKDEFAKALVQPGYTLFDIVDRNLDGQLTEDEIGQAMQIAFQQVTRMGVTPPSNSPAAIVGDGTASR